MRRPTKGKVPNLKETWQRRAPTNVFWISLVDCNNSSAISLDSFASYLEEVFSGNRKQLYLNYYYDHPARVSSKHKRFVLPVFEPPLTSVQF